LSTLTLWAYYNIPVNIFPITSFRHPFYNPLDLPLPDTNGLKIPHLIVQQKMADPLMHEGDLFYYLIS